MIRNLRLRPKPNGVVSLQIQAPASGNWYNVVDFRPDGRIQRSRAIPAGVGIDTDAQGRIRHA